MDYRDTYPEQIFHRVYGKYGRHLTAIKRSFRDARAESDNGKWIIAKIKAEYESGDGFKILAKRYHTTYSRMRTFCNTHFKCRHGVDVVTNKLCARRREKALYESKHKIGFNSPNVVRKYGRNTRGVQYWFINEYTGNRVWLRSTWEYIYAKWLNKTGHNWKIEERCYIIDGLIYRPDFFIYNSNDELEKIVEIKGFWDSNSDKALKLDDQLLNIEVCLVRDISDFIEDGLTYHQELENWKKIKELKIYG